MNSVICGKLDGTGKHYAKWDKSGTEKQILNIFTDIRRWKYWSQVSRAEWWNSGYPTVGMA